MAAKKNTYYFTHDCNARSDEKLLAVRMRYCAEGYAVYFMLLEMLAAETDHSLSRDYYTIAFELHVDPEIVRSVIEDFGLFCFDEKRFYSTALNERMASIDNLRQQRSNAGQMSAIRRALLKETAKSTNVEQNINTTATVVNQNLNTTATNVDPLKREKEKEKKNQKENKEKEKERKGEERKEKERKEEENTGGFARVREEAPLKKIEIQEKKISEVVLRKWKIHYKRHYATEYVPDFRSLTNDTATIAEAVSQKMRDFRRDPNDIDDVKQFVDDMYETMRIVADKWQRDHWTLHTVATQFNELYQKIINGTSSTNNSLNPGSNQSSTDYLAGKMQEAGLM